MMALIINVKSPKVMIVIGRVKIVSMGLRVKLAMPSTSATKSAVRKSFTCTPLNIMSATYTATPFNNNLTKIIILL